MRKIFQDNLVSDFGVVEIQCLLMAEQLKLQLFDLLCLWLARPGCEPVGQSPQNYTVAFIGENF